MSGLTEWGMPPGHVDPSSGPSVDPRTLRSAALFVNKQTSK